jgi:hypothetical protein
MTEEQIMHAEWVRSMLSGMRGQGVIISGQAVYERIRSGQFICAVIVTNVGGDYTFDVVAKPFDVEVTDEKEDR